MKRLDGGDPREDELILGDGGVTGRRLGLSTLEAGGWRVDSMVDGKRKGINLRVWCGFGRLPDAGDYSLKEVTTCHFLNRLRWG